MKYILIACTFLIFVGCDSKSGSSDKSTSDSSSAKTETKDPKAAQGLDLVAKSDCFTCHKLTEYSIGPAYSAIAQKYKTINPATLDSMIGQIQNGGSGRWGTVPMTPHPTISKEDAELMVHYIMSIKP